MSTNRAKSPRRTALDRLASNLINAEPSRDGNPRQNVVDKLAAAREGTQGNPGPSASFIRTPSVRSQSQGTVVTQNPRSQIIPSSIVGSEALSEAGRSRIERALGNYPDTFVPDERTALGEAVNSGLPSQTALGGANDAVNAGREVTEHLSDEARSRISAAIGRNMNELPVASNHGSRTASVRNVDAGSQVVRTERNEGSQTLRQLTQAERDQEAASHRSVSRVGPLMEEQEPETSGNADPPGDPSDDPSDPTDSTRHSKKSSKKKKKKSQAKKKRKSKRKGRGKDPSDPDPSDDNSSTSSSSSSSSEDGDRRVSTNPMSNHQQGPIIVNVASQSSLPKLEKLEYAKLRDFLHEYRSAKILNPTLRIRGCLARAAHDSVRQQGINVDDDVEVEAYLEAYFAARVFANKPAALERIEKIQWNFSLADPEEQIDNFFYAVNEALDGFTPEELKVKEMHICKKIFQCLPKKLKITKGEFVYREELQKLTTMRQFLKQHCVRALMATPESTPSPKHKRRDSNRGNRDVAAEEQAQPPKRSRKKKKKDEEKKTVSSIRDLDAAEKRQHEAKIYIEARNPKTDRFEKLDFAILDSGADLTAGPYDKLIKYCKRTEDPKKHKEFAVGNDQKVQVFKVGIIQFKVCSEQSQILANSELIFLTKENFPRFCLSKHFCRKLSLDPESALANLFKSENRS